MKIDHRFGKLTPDLISQLTSIVGQKNILTGEGRENYARDESPHSEEMLPEAVLKPESPEAIGQILRLANTHRIPITPRGAGTGISGGAVPVYGGISLSLERMNRILEIDEANFSATAEAGVALAELCTAIEEKGLYYPLYPGEKSASIGGNVATNAGGMRAVKYGVTRNFVLGLEAVLPSGEIITTGGKFFKCSTGYDLTQLLTGSEGTLAIITKVIVRLIAPPGSREILFIPFHTLNDAIHCVPVILKEKILPVGIEFMEQDLLSMVEEFTGKEIPLHGYPAYLMLIIESENQGEFERITEQISEICMRQGAVDVFVPGSENAKRNLLEAREKFYSTMQHRNMLDIADVVVPRSQIAEFVRNVKDISRKYGIPVIAYGHAGDGNVHLHPIGTSVAENRKKALLSEIFKEGIKLGGTISGEHGLGLFKKEYLHLAEPSEKIELLKRIKQAFDPNNIMNPGKVLE
jgi:glycolate oxidase